MSLKHFAFHRETGRLALDLIATLGERHITQLERLNTSNDLARWLSDVAGETDEIVLAECDLAEAKRLRASILGLVNALFLSKQPDGRDIQTINNFAAAFYPVRLAESGTALKPDSQSTALGVFGKIARDAIEMAIGPDAAKMRLCASEDCSVYFIDRSRPGKRRWCSMSRCGNREKKKKFVGSKT